MVGCLVTSDRGCAGVQASAVFRRIPINARVRGLGLGFRGDLQEDLQLLASTT